MPQTQVGERVRARLLLMNKLRANYNVAEELKHSIIAKGRGATDVTFNVKRMNSI
jgi:hypothetical protein